MSDLRRILGTSALSLLLAIWGLFMVCSGRVPDVNYDEDLMVDEGFGGDYVDPENSELMNQLAVLDDESTKLEDYQRNEILDALGINSNGSDISQTEEDNFLTEELFLDLEVEIAELEKVARQKSVVADSLRMEVAETDYQLAALGNVVGPTSSTDNRPVRTSRTISSGTTKSIYGSQYDDALNDVYARNFSQAIAKFRNLLKQSDSDQLSDNCQYWIGESYYALGQYDVALTEFEKVFAFSDNNKMDDAQFMIGMTYVRLGDQSAAKVELQNLLSFYQDSEYVTRAEREFGSLNM